MSKKNSKYNQQSIGKEPIIDLAALSVAKNITICLPQ